MDGGKLFFMLRRCMVLFLMAIALAAHANPFGDLVVLIPLNPGHLAGAFDTDWRTTVWVHNSSDIDAVINCPSDLDQCSKIKAHSTIELQNPWTSTPGPFFLRIRAGIITPGPSADGVWVEMRTADVGTSARSAGTEIPLARPSDFRAGTLILPHVPVNNHSRLRLRVYGSSNGSATIRGIGSTSGQPLVASTLTLAGNDGNLAGARFPSYAEQLLSTPIGADDSMRIEITSTSSIWAFITVTDNDSQQFTVIAPANPEYVPISVAQSDFRYSTSAFFSSSLSARCLKAS